MASGQVAVLPSAMLTRWRRRRLCTLARESAPATPAVLRAIDGFGARVECVVALTPGEPVAIRHPDAGAIEARVASMLDGEARLAFAGDTASVAFALAVIASDMSQPG